ncbi:hypothetical protein BASA81_003400 [Batrachochytrium salamandrivorans]|nr:hypothetical protein BASA81_003400 [Batrachochytrium salamandrivorans]
MEVGKELELLMRSKGVSLEELLAICQNLASAPASKPELVVRLVLNDFQCETEYRLFMRMEVEDWLVTGLDVSDTNIAGELLCALLSDVRSQIISLNLCNTRFALWNARMVSNSFANLLSINLSWNGLRDLSKVTFPPKLRELNVSHNELGDGFCTQIVSMMPCLEVLNIEGNSISASGLGMLVRRAKWKTLLIKGSGWEVMDAESTLAMQWQLVGKHLTELSLDVDSQGVFGFAFPLAHERCQLTLLSLSCHGIKGSPTLRARKHAFKAFCLGLAINRSLVRLSLDGFGLTAKCTLRLSKAMTKTRITELSLRNNTVRDVGLRHLLAHCGMGLRVLDLEANEIRSVRDITKAIFSDRLCGLHVLNLKDNLITEDGGDRDEFIRALRHAHSDLREVDCKGNPAFPHELLRHTLDCVRVGRGLLVLRGSILQRVPRELFYMVGHMLCGKS